MKRIVDVSGYGCKLKLDCGRLVLEGKDGSLVTIPVAEVAVVVLSNAAVSVSGAVLAELATEGVAVIVSDRAHLPVGLFQPIAANYGKLRFYSVRFRQSLQLRRGYGER